VGPLLLRFVHARPIEATLRHLLRNLNCFASGLASSLTGALDSTDEMDRTADGVELATRLATRLAAGLTTEERMASAADDVARAALVLSAEVPVCDDEQAQMPLLFLFFVFSSSFTGLSFLVLRCGTEAALNLGAALLFPATLLVFVRPVPLPYSWAAPAEALDAFATVAAAVLCAALVVFHLPTRRAAGGSG